MKACVLEKPYDVRIKELPIPEPKDDEVLLRVTVAGICTNDVRDYKGSRYCLLYTSPSPRDMRRSRMPSSA